MAKIDGYNTPTLGGNSIGGEWFYYLFRFDDFMQFTEVPVYGKPQAFCTDCRNPVARADFVWNLHLYVRGRETPTFDDGVQPATGSVDPPPQAVCADGHLGIGSEPPPDVPFAPSTVPEADRQPMFDCFSWRTFAALNWPVSSDERGEPAAGGSLSDLGPPRVWESYKETAEVFQPEISGWTIDDQHWNDTQFVPEVCQQHVASLPQPQQAKVLQMITKTRSHQILNETHQAMGNQFNILVDQSGRLVQYEVRFNRDEFEYLKANKLANTGNYSFGGPNDFEVFFPTNADGATGLGAIEIKAAWRELCVLDAEGQCLGAEDLEDRYYTQVGLIYTPDTRQSNESCRLARVGLVGLHIIRKTVHAPQWVWSTFEHVDNVPPFGQPGEAGRQYLLYDSACEENPPSDEFCSRMRPGVLPFAQEETKNCCPNAQLIVNADPGRPGTDGRLQAEAGALVKNQATRLVAVGPTDLNQRFQAALPAPWNQYFLLNTQWPSGGRQGAEDPEPGAARRIPCNVVDLLWEQGGAFAAAGIPKPSCYTMQPRGDDGELKLRNTTMETYQTAWHQPGTAATSQFSSQSCFNCHGFGGVDFSFVWTDGTEEIVPFPPP
ncbi:MAG: hypothetical protein AAGC60_16695 [Acidobacteriota bacterium]